ncbi:hypothetical protein HYV73_02040, partial [Candidatus Uhrbacteria bacterium]|nr:hypothetical protein [Candidatus Uhrbacteria bacterium]
MDPKKSYPELSIVLVSMALAFFLDLLFDARLPFFGLNLPLFTILFLGGTTFIAHRFHWKMWKFLWFPATGMVFFSLPFAIHTSGWALTLSMVGLICSSFVLLMRLFGVRFHFPHPLHVLSYGLGPVIVGFVRNTKVMSRAFDSLPRLKSSIPWRQVAWGIGFAVPILLLFLVLFTNADPVFGDKINTFFDKILFSWIEAERFFRGIGHIVIFL